MESIADFLKSSLDTAWCFLNSSLVIAFVGGLTGAVGGALGAQHIVERRRRRDEALSELRAVNAAITVSHTACNAALAIKSQHFKQMSEKYMEDRRRIVDISDRAAQGKEIEGTMHFVADLQLFPGPVFPLETLKELVFQKISAHGRPLALVSAIDQSLSGLNDAIVRREMQVKRFQSGQIPKELFPNYYFGLQLPSGDTPNEYLNLVEVIGSYLDDLIFFTELLCKELEAHGNRVRNAYLKKNGSEKAKEKIEKRRGGTVPRISKTDFSGPRGKGLMPPESDYSSWLEGLREMKE